MAIQSLHDGLLSQFSDLLAPVTYSLPTLQSAFRCLFRTDQVRDGESYLLVHWPRSLLKVLPDPPLGSMPHVLQWFRVNEHGLFPESRDASGLPKVHARDPFRKEFLLYGRFGTGSGVFLAKEVPKGNCLFRSRPSPYSVIWSTEPKVLKAVRSRLGEELPEWAEHYGARLQLKGKKGEPDQSLAVMDSLQSLEPGYRSLVRDQWMSSVVQRFQQISWNLNPETMIRQVGRAFKEHVGYDHFELTVKHYPGLPAQPDGAFSVRESKVGGELLSIILDSKKSARFLKSKKPVFIPDVSKFPGFMNPALLAIMNIRCGILIPIWSGNDELGLIKLFFCRQVEIQEDDKRLLDNVAGDIGRALSNALRFHLSERRATIDGLTNVFNHRFFVNQIRKEFNRARRYKNALSLIMIDVDNFKEYNDTNGHPGGDRVLAKVAELIQGSVREIDLVARYGGDEFALILPENDARQGLIVAEKVRKVIENHHFENEEKLPGGTLTISLGISENSQDVKLADEMVEIADEALYWVKRHGGNRSKIGNRGAGT